MRNETIKVLEELKSEIKQIGENENFTPNYRYGMSDCRGIIEKKIEQIKKECES